MSGLRLFDIPESLQALDGEVTAQIAPRLIEIDELAGGNAARVLKAFTDHRVTAGHFAGSTGYGYDDRGREVLEAVFADSMGAEDALVRTAFLSGTHTIAVALFGLLRPGDHLLCLTGRPYDTLHGALGLGEDNNDYGSLKDFGVHYHECALAEEGWPDETAIAAALQKRVHRVIYIQRSRGYTLRPSLSVEGIGRLVKLVRACQPEAWIVVDNCYGEFVEQVEPTAVGADLMVGSLIKNAGGGLAPMGGYIAGRHELVERCAHRLSAPGVGREIGATMTHLRELFMGLFHAPHAVAEALKTAVYAAALFERLGYTVSPGWDAPRADIIQSVQLGGRERLIAFCRGIQRGSPVDSFALPEPAPMPGYDSEVIMAAGTFIGGASIELSADAPLREPYAVWLQGGLDFSMAKIGVLLAAKDVLNTHE